MATLEEANLFAEQILAPVGAGAAGLPDQDQNRELTGFLAMRGHLYTRELMVVGRAVNGWMPYGVCPMQFHSGLFRNWYATEVLHGSLHAPGVAVVQGQLHCPMDWVYINPPNGFNADRSAFWRVIRNVTNGLHIADDTEPHQRPSHLVWSNLYKLSPSAEGNPSWTLRGVQLAGCQALFQLELHTYCPKRLLLLTGADWAAPFLGALGVHDVAVGEFQYVERTGWLVLPNGHHAQFVVACHPMTRPEDDWTQEVLQAF